MSAYKTLDLKEKKTSFTAVLYSSTLLVPGIKGKSLYDDQSVEQKKHKEMRYES